MTISSRSNGLGSIRVSCATAQKHRSDGARNSERQLRRGAGSDLIERALPAALGATTDMNFTSGGLRCIIKVPLVAIAA